MAFYKSLALGLLFSLGMAQATETMNLRDKIGQMLIIGFEGKQVDKDSPIIRAINEDNLGGVILFDYNPRTQKFDKNIASPSQVRELNQRLQEATSLANQSYHREQLPLLISVDYEGGSVNRLREDYGFPQTFPAVEVAKMAAEEASKIAEQMGQTLEDAGFNLNFAPELDLNINPNNPVIGLLGRSFSDDSKVVADYATIYSRHFLKHKSQCVYKHFPGHGSSIFDSHLGFVDVTKTWQEAELDPYKFLLGGPESCAMVMSAHIVNRKLDESGLPATLSYKILTEILRQQLQFDGVIVTDDMQMKAISEHYSLGQALSLAINAGADMLIFGNQLVEKPLDPKEIIDLIEAKVKSGEISQARIDEAYQHITVFKRSLI